LIYYYIYASAIAGLAACGGLFRDSTGAFLGAFCYNIGEASIFHSEVIAAWSMRQPIGGGIFGWKATQIVHCGFFQTLP